ncbi:hypothetical protein Fmac_027474 [Flemingia macrophylla]|uniref:Uncharacterized protein n=1 Tax=Flemingia macrophylla TaxID=520843 RepID=A0ABD1LHS7_9FABA
MVVSPPTYAFNITSFLLATSFSPSFFYLTPQKKQAPPSLSTMKSSSHKSSFSRSFDPYFPRYSTQINTRESEIEKNKRRDEEAEAENERLRKKLQELKLRAEENEGKIKMLEDEVVELKKTALCSGGVGHEASQRLVKASSARSRSFP